MKMKKATLSTLRRIVIITITATLIMSCDDSQNAELKVEELLQNTDDPEDSEINKVLHSITIELKDFIETNKGSQQDLLNLFSGEEILITDSLRNSTDFFTQLNHSVLDSQKKPLISLQKKMFYQDQRYFPSLRLYQPNFNKESEIIFCIGSEVNDDDEIVCYIEGIPILVSEKKADSFTNPTIIVNVGSNKIAEIGKSKQHLWEGDKEEEISNNKQSTSTYVAKWDSYQIKDGYRYESSGSSELAYLMHNYLPNTSSTTCWDNEMFGSWNPYTPLEEEIIRKIRKKDIEKSKEFHKDKYLTEQPVFLTNLNGNQFYITVHERDWYASRKAVQGCCSSHLTLMHKPRMKYSSNWYYNEYCGFGFQGSWVGASFSVSNHKCSLKMKRTQ